MNGDAHATGALMMQQQQQQQHGMSLPMPTSFAAASSNNNKPRLPPGLPPTPPQPTSFQRGGVDVCMDVDQAAAPRKQAHHRRSSSDVPFGYFPGTMMMGGNHHQLPPPKVEAAGCWGGHHHGGDAAADDLFITSYLNLDGGLDGLNANSSDYERHEEDGDDSRGSSMKTNDGSSDDENESEEGADDGGIRLKRQAGEPAPMVVAGSRHARSLSMDSSFIGKFNFSAAANGVVMGPNRQFSLEFGAGEFTPAEMKKIMADEKLAEMALADPKRVKRVLANRQSAARSKERKMRYIAELEHKVQILQTEATTLAAQLTLLQRDSAGIAAQNNELKFRLQAMEQQAQLRDALNDALTAEVQRLKLATAELGDSCSSDNLSQQIRLNVQDQMFQLQQQQQQATPIPFYQLQQPQQNGAAKNQHESKE